MPAVSLDAYRRMTLAASLAGVALFGGGLVVLVQQGGPLLALALMAAGAMAVLAPTALRVEGAPPAEVPSLLLYTRPDCSLCDEARARLEAMRREQAFDVWEVDITGQPDLEARYGTLVPVGVVGDQEVFRLEMDEARVGASLGLPRTAPA